MRLNRARVLLRAVLLTLGATFLFFKAWEARHAARLVTGGAASLLSRVALVEALMGMLGLAAAAVALLALRRRKRTHTLHLSDLASPDAAKESPGDRGHQG
ncbi:MAG TPA: hypothetical protein VFG59_04545 [Anaeromyxobacter sp.]|nr:hypothetical protein [Anaeromyxobacter sp.]